MSTGDPAMIENGTEYDLFTSQERLEMNSIASQAGSSGAATRKITVSSTIDDGEDEDDDELERKEFVPRTPRSPLRLITYTIAISFGILTMILSINGAVMAFGMYGLYSSARENLAFDLVTIDGLDDLAPLISVDAKFPVKGLSKLVGFEIKEGSRITIQSPQQVSSRLPKGASTLMTVDIPAVKLARGNLGALSVHGIQALINEEIPLSDLAFWYMNADQDAVVNVKGVIKVFTWSFLIPISYNYNLNMAIPLKSKEPKREPSKQLASMESLEFYEDNHKDRFRCLMGLNLKESLVPAYIETRLPNFAFSIQNAIDPEYPETILQVHVKEQDISRGKPRNMQVHFEVNGRNQVDSLKAVLEYVRDKDYDFDLAVTGSKLVKDKKPSKLQTWLSTLHVRAAASTMLSKQPKRIISETQSATEINGKAVATMKKLKIAGLVVLGETRKTAQKIRQASRQLFGQEEEKKPVDLAVLFDEPETSEDIHPVSFGFVGLEGNSSSPRFLFRFGFSTKFLYKLTGINLGAIKGKLPPIHLQNLLDRTIASADSQIGLADIKIEQERLSWPNEIRFLIRVDLKCASDLLLVASKLFHQRRANARGLSIDRAGLKSVSIGGSDENVLSSILSVFQVEWNFEQSRLGMKRGPRYHLDPADAEYSYEDKNKSHKVGGYRLDVLEKEVKRVIHEATVELASDSNNISLTSKVTLDKRPSFNRNPYLYLYWESVYASIFPTKIRQEMMSLRLSKGSFHVKMATGVNPALLLFKGGLELVLSLSGPSILDVSEDEKPKTDLGLVTIWKEAYKNWAKDQNHLGLSVQVAVRNQSLNVDFDLPRKRDLLGAGSDRKGWTMWTERLIQSNFSLAGIHEGVLTFLVNLPEANRCEIMPNPKLKIIGRIRLPAFGLNVCADKSMVEDRKKADKPKRTEGEDEINEKNMVCLFKIGLSKPIETELIFHDGAVCDVITRFVEDRETFIKHRQALLGGKRRATRQGTQFDDGLLHKVKHALALRNVIPMYLSILDLDSALSVAPDLFAHDMNKLLITAGYQHPSSYHDTSLPLIERFGNGFISAFQEYLPRWGQQGLKRARNVVERVSKNLVLPTSVVVTSTDANHMSCTISLNIPRESYGNSQSSSSDSMSDVKDEASTSFAEFMRVRWGKTEVNVRPVPYGDNQSSLRIVLDQGQFYLNSQAAAAELTSSLHGTSNILSMRIDMHAGPHDFSSSILQTIKNYLVVAFNYKESDASGRLRFNYPRELVAVAEKIPELAFQAELRSSIFRHENGTIDSEEDTRDANEYSISREIKGKFVISLMRQVYTIMQGKKKKEDEPNKIKPWDYHMVIEPRPFADKKVVNVPFLFDTNCRDPNTLMALDDPDDRRLVKFNLRVHQLIYHVMKMFADNFAVLMKNIGLYRHPGKLLLTVRLPQMVLNGSVNGIGMVEATMKEFDLVRTLDLSYDMPGEVKSEDKNSLTDVEVLKGEARWGKNVRDFANIISPASIAMSMGLQVELKDMPQHSVDLQNMPMTMAFSNEHVDRPKRNLFTSMFCTWYGEHPISPMLREMSTAPGRIQTHLKDVNLERLVIEAQEVFIPWPVPRILVQVDKPVWIDFVCKELVFLAIKVNPLTLQAPETRIAKASVTLSRTSFGALPVDRFSKTFAEFIAGLVLGRSLDFNMRIRIADGADDPESITVNVPFYLPQKDAKLAFFDTIESDVLVDKLIEGYVGQKGLATGQKLGSVLSPLLKLGGKAVEFAKYMANYEMPTDPKLDDSSKRLYPRSLPNDDRSQSFADQEVPPEKQPEQNQSWWPSWEGAKRTGSSVINFGKAGISRIASGTYNFGSATVSGGYNVVSSGVNYVRQKTVGPNGPDSPRIASDEEPSLQRQIEEVLESEKLLVVNMDELIYPVDKGKSERGSKKQNTIIPSKKIVPQPRTYQDMLYENTVGWFYTSPTKEPSLTKDSKVVEVLDSDEEEQAAEQKQMHNNESKANVVPEKPQPPGIWRLFTNKVGGGFTAAGNLLGDSGQFVFDNTAGRLFTSNLAAGESQSPGILRSITNRVGNVLRNGGQYVNSQISSRLFTASDGNADESQTTVLQEMQMRFTKGSEYVAGGAKWKSTYQKDDLVDSTLDDMTWLGFSEKTGPGFFDNMPGRNMYERNKNMLFASLEDEWRLDDIYALSFMNASPYSMAVVGQLLNLYFTDTDGLISPGKTAVIEKPFIPATMQVLPKNCQWHYSKVTPSIVSQLRCIHHNVGQPAVPCPPKSHHKGKDRFLAPLSLKLNDLALLADEKFKHDGLCINIKDSYVVLGIFDPHDHSKYILFDLILNMEDVETLEPNDDHGDPCGKVFRVIPDKQVVLWGRKRSKNFLAHLKPEMRLEASKINGDDEWHIDPSQSQAFKLIFEPIDANDSWAWKFYGYMTPTEFLWEVRDTEHYVAERGSIAYGRKPIMIVFSRVDKKVEIREVNEVHSRPLYSKVIDDLTSSRFPRLSVFGPNHFDIHEPALPAHSARFYDKHNGIHWDTEPVNLEYPAVYTMTMKTNVPARDTAEHQRAHDRFGFCWRVFSSIDQINPFYGAAGRAVCVYFYPSAGQILHIVDHSTGQIVHKKPRAALHTNFFGGEKERQIKVIYNKLAPSKMSIAIDPDQVGHRYSSRYNLDLEGLLRLQPGEKVYFGFFTELVGGNPFDAGNYFDYSLKLAYTLPDFTKTSVYFEETQSPLPHQEYTFLIQMRDEFDNGIFKAPLGLRVALLPIDERTIGEDNPRAGNFVWADRPEGYPVPELVNPTAADIESPMIDLTRAPKRHAIQIEDLKSTENGLYKATVRNPSPGRYRILIQHALTSERMSGYVPDRADKPRSSKWHVVRNSHIYVRNYFDIE